MVVALLLALGVSGTSANVPVVQDSGRRRILRRPTAGAQSDVEFRCLRDSNIPQIFSLTVSAPNPAQLLARPPIYYAAGSEVDVAVELPNCIGLESVALGANQVPAWDQANRIEGGQEYYRVIEDRPWYSRPFGPQGGKASQPADRHRVTLRLHFTNLGQGHSALVRVGARSVASVGSRGQAATYRHFTLVGVKRVGGRVMVTLPETELRNLNTLGTYQKFQSGSYTARSVAYNVTVVDPITHATTTRDSVVTSVTLYDPVYPPAVTLGDGLIHMRWVAKARVAGWCDPTVTTTGLFTVAVDPTGHLFLQWPALPPVPGGGPAQRPANPDVDLDMPLRCDIGAGPLTAIQQIVLRLIEGMAAEQVPREITQSVDSVMGTLNCPGNGCGSWIESIHSTAGRLDVVLRQPVTKEPVFPASVTIDVPYRALGPRAAGAPTGVAVPAGLLFVFARGTNSLCSDDRARAPSCPSLVAGPNGLFHNGNNPFWNPRRPDQGFYGEAARASNGLYKVIRQPQFLPIAGGPVDRPWAPTTGNAGALIARVHDGQAEGSVKVIGTANGVPISPATAWIRFGMNDHTRFPVPGDRWEEQASNSGNEHGSGALEVALVFELQAAARPAASLEPTTPLPPRRVRRVPGANQRPSQ